MSPEAVGAVESALGPDGRKSFPEFFGCSPREVSRKPGRPSWVRPSEARTRWTSRRELPSRDRTLIVDVMDGGVIACYPNFHC